MHIHVVIDARAAAAFPFLGCGQAAEVADVVVAEQQRDIFRQVQAGIVILLNLREKRPDLRHFRSIGVQVLSQNLSLVGDDFLQQFLIRLKAARVWHGKVAVPAHANGDEAFVVLVSLNAFGPKLLEPLLVGG